MMLIIAALVCSNVFAWLVIAYVLHWLSRVNYHTTAWMRLQEDLNMSIAEEIGWKPTNPDSPNREMLLRWQREV